MKTKTSFKKGEAKGKPKGALNHTTRDIKEAFQYLIERNVDKMEGWLNAIAAKDPAKAIQIICELSEYIVPKLARSEMDLKTNFFDSENIFISYEAMNEGNLDEHTE